MSDPRVTKFVWFEEPDYHNNRFLPKTKETQKYHDEKTNQSENIARHDDETFSE